jgi:hypothetical protein
MAGREEFRMDLDKERLELSIRLSAIEYMVAHTLNILLKHSGADEKAIAEVEAKASQMFRTTTFPGLDPALSDHLSAEFAAAIERLQDMARWMRAAALKQRE